VERIDKYVILAYTSLIGIGASAVFLPVPVYLHMIFTTMLIIYIGSVTSCSDLDEALNDTTTTAERPSTKVSKKANVEKMKTKDAYMFPVIGSFALLSLYIVFKYFPKEYVNLVLKVYFGFFGVIVLGTKISDLINGILPISLVTTLQGYSASTPVPNFEFYYNKFFGFIVRPTENKNLQASEKKTDYIY